MRSGSSRRVDADVVARARCAQSRAWDLLRAATLAGLAALPASAPRPMSNADARSHDQFLVVPAFETPSGSQRPRNERATPEPRAAIDPRLTQFVHALVEVVMADLERDGAWS